MNNLKLTDKDTIRLVRQAFRNNKPVYINRVKSLTGFNYQTNRYRVIHLRDLKSRKLLLFKLIDGSNFQVFESLLENYTIDID